MPRNVELPDSLAGLLTEPQRIRDAVELLNALANLEVHLVPAGNVKPLKPGYHQIAGEAPALVLPLPLRLRAPIADSSATAASASAQLNTLLGYLRETGQLPTA